MLELIVLGLYRWILYPVFRLGFLITAQFNPKVRRSLEMRKINHDRQIASGGSNRRPERPVWIHCASFEFEYAKPLIRLLKTLRPQTQILVTYFSSSVERAVQTFPGVDHSCPVPWDQRSHLKAFFDTHDPQMLLISRTDTWPEMLDAATQRGIPRVLFAATLSSKSGRMKWYARPLSRLIVQKISSIFCVSEEDASNFRKLGFRGELKVLGDTRFDQVLDRLKHPKPIKALFSTEDSRRVLIAGSTWHEDEAVLLPAFVGLKHRLALIIAPHEPTPLHLAQLKEKLEGLGLTYELYSQIQTPQTHADVVIIDVIGILAELYQLADYAFVGGSFRKSVHSVMEPLAAGLITVLGPKHENNREAIEFQSVPVSDQLQAVMIFSDHDSGGRLFERLVQSQTSEGRLGTKAKIKQAVSDRGGASQRVVEFVISKISTQENVSSANQTMRNPHH